MANLFFCGDLVDCARLRLQIGFLPLPASFKSLSSTILYLSKTDLILCPAIFKQIDDGTLYAYDLEELCRGGYGNCRGR